MDCQSFIDRLDDFLEGKLSSDARSSAAEHLRRCERCRDLAAAFEQDGKKLAPPSDLVGAILQRTSGSTCASAHDRICDQVDGLLGSLDNELVRSHLDRCGECAALSGAISQFTVDLPTLAELEPDEPFVQAVLARTVRRRRRTAAWADKLAAQWEALLQRPRLAWEGAYVATFVLALLFLTPWSPLSGTAQQIAEMVRGGTDSTIENSMGGLGERMASGVPAAWQASGGRMIATLQGVPHNIDRLSQDAREGIERGLGTLTGRDTSEQENATTDRSPEADRTEGDRP
jgi:predicted anti-sigma-YlaC factor YlaD